MIRNGTARAVTLIVTDYTRELNMIDETGNLQDAIDLIARLAGIAGKPRLIELQQERVTLLDVFTGDVSRILPFNGGMAESQMRFQYLWK